MKTALKTILTGCLIAIGSFALAQDVIITKDSKKIDAKVIEVNVDNIKYKNFDDQDGLVYTIPKNEVISILYQNGTIFANSTGNSSVNQYDCVKSPILEDVRMDGNTIYYKNKLAGKRDMMEILQKTYYPSYKKYVSGSRAVTAAGGLFITGAAIGIGGMLVGGGGNVNGDGDVTVAVGIVMLIVGSAEIITSIPLAAVGYAKKSKAKREFIRHCLTFQPEKTEKQLDLPHLDFNVKSNGVGLAWTF